MGLTAEEMTAAKQGTHFDGGGAWGRGNAY